MARELKCDSCQEVRLPKPAGHVSLQKCDTLWHTLQMDMAQIKYKDQVLHVLFLVDEASHYLVTHEMCRHHSSQSWSVSTDEITKAIENTWVLHYGLPNTLKCDPEGAFRGHNFALWGQERGVDIQPCAAEAHEQIGDVESLIGKIKVDVRTYLRDKDLDPYDGVLHMVHAHNSLDRVGGFAPCQWVFGRFPSMDGRLFDGGHEIPVLSSQGTSNTDMRANLNFRVKAEELYRRTQGGPKNFKSHEQ